MANGRVGVVAGNLLRGDGGFNAPWSWHMDPTTVTFPDAATEVCDGCPSFVETSVRNAVPGSSLGSYCPWSAQLIARDR